MKTIYVCNRGSLWVCGVATVWFWFLLYNLVQSGGMSPSSVFNRSSGLERLVGAVFITIFRPAVYVLLSVCGPISLVWYSKCIVCNGNRLIEKMVFGLLERTYLVSSIERIEVVVREKRSRWLFRKAFPKCRIVFRSREVLWIEYGSNGYKELIEYLQGKGCVLVY